MTIYQRLRDLREDADKTQSDIAELLGTTAQYYGRYEKGEIELPLSRAIQLANYYDVSLDYLAGRSLFKRETALNEDEERLIKCWRELSERSKGKIDYHIEELLKSEQQNNPFNKNSP